MIGKTIQGIGCINCLPEIKHVLIVCPASLKINWMQELNKWLIRPYKIGIVNSDCPWPNAEIFIVNYDILVQPCPICKGQKKEEKRQCKSCNGTGSYTKFPQLFDMTWDMIIADESQRIKAGKKAKSARAFMNLSAKRKLALSGTPIMNRPIEIQSTLEWLDKNTWGNRWMFAKRYCNLMQTRFGADMSGASNLGELQQRLRGGGYMIRRLKDDVLPDLPPKFRQVIELPAEGVEHLLESEWNAYHKYEAVLQHLKVAYQLAKASESDTDYHLAVEELRKGKNAAFTEMALVRKQVALTKLPYVIQHLNENANEQRKALLFCHHHEIVDKICSEFISNCVNITGRVPPDKRQGIVDIFQTRPDIFLFVGNIKAAGEGLTLTASSLVIFAELDWTPSRISQCEDRSRRIGQTKNVLCQHLVLEGSLDAVMAKRIIEKQKVIDKALDAEIVQEVEEFDIEEEVATASTTRKEIVSKAVNVQPQDESVIHESLRFISTLCDGARSKDGLGWSKIDREIGSSLANSNRLTQRQAYLGLKLVKRHAKQLPDELKNKIQAILDR